MKIRYVTLLAAINPAMAANNVTYLIFILQSF